MSAPKLTTKQRNYLALLIAADYSSAAIRERLANVTADCELRLPSQLDAAENVGAKPKAVEKKKRPIGHFPILSDAALSYYRKLYRKDIEKLRSERRAAALSSGLAIKAERVARLCHHADRLELMAFVEDKNGRLWNERAWRQTLEDIALELGERRPKDNGGGGGGDDVVKIVVGIDYEKL